MNDYQEQALKLMSEARNLPFVDKRDGIRDQILECLVKSMKITSAYICHHDFVEKTSLIRNVAFSIIANDKEREAEVGELTLETEHSQFNRWLREATQHPHILYVDDLLRDDPKRAEHGASAVLFLCLFFQQRVWGYIEICDSQDRRYFTRDEIDTAQFMRECIEKTILTDLG